MDRPALRRPDFDAATMGWGSDAKADLAARIALVHEWAEKAGPFTPAETKIMAAMQKREAEFL